MKTTSAHFRNWPNKAITLLGMSGVGKTTLAAKLPKDRWFHYSGDYRIGTRYLDEIILDTVKQRAMQDPYLKELFCRDYIYIRNNITVNNLAPISYFLGKIGNPELGGLSCDEFLRRQRQFRRAEVRAMQDVTDFMERAREIYHYPHFLNDAGGSIYDLTEQECWTELSEKTVVLYLQTDDALEKLLIQRAQADPKPLYYDEKFLKQHLQEYLESNNLRSEEEIEPDAFVQWVFPRLVSYRKPKYEALAEKYGHSVDATTLSGLRDESDIIDFICTVADT